MLVRLFGVRFHLAQGLTVEELFEQLQQIDGEQFRSGGQQRIAYSDTVGDYCVALFLTIKDNRRWMEMTKTGKKVRVNPREVAAGKSLVDFNFLAVHKTSGRGLFQHYHGSLSIPKLRSIFWNQHRILVSVKRAEWMEVNDGTVNASKKQHKGEFVLAQIMRDEDMPVLLKRLSLVKSLTLDFDGLKDSPGGFGPLGQFVKSSRYKVNFEANIKGRAVADKIVGIWAKKDQEQIKAARVEGQEGDEERTYDLEEDFAPTTYGQFDFDTIAEPFDSDDFTTAPLLKQMMARMDKDPSTFHAEIDE